MFFRIDEDYDSSSIQAKSTRNDEKSGKDDFGRWTIIRIVFDAMAAGMIVTIVLDLWRLALGPVFDPNLLPTFVKSRDTLPWLE